MDEIEFRELLDKMKMFGLLKYNLKKIISILRGKVDEEYLINQFRDQNSEIYKSYASGRDNSDFASEKPIFDEMLRGNIDAAKFLEDKRKAKDYEERVNQIFGEDEI
jgi:hypothetical protein